MSNNINEKTEELIDAEKLTPQEEQEAYFLLVQIFSNAQATQNQAQFEHDLSEWKKRFKIDRFSDEYKRKIKYMLSKEFLDTIIKNFSIYQEQAQMDYSKGLDKLYKIFNNAKKHKNPEQLDKDLDALFSKYSIDIFKRNYPHIMSKLLSKSYRNEVLENNDKTNEINESNAINELNEIVENPQKFSNADNFKSAVEAWQKLHPVESFNDKNKSQVEQILSIALDERNLEKNFPATTELDLTEGHVVTLDIDPFEGKTRSQFFENARKEFFDIVNVNIGDTDRTFSWIYKYGRYINEFDTDTKNAIVNNLMKKYHAEFSSSKTNYRMPEMDSDIDELLTLSDFESIDDTKKQVVLQLLGILYNGLELTHDDISRLDIINSNVQKARIIEETHISDKLDDFMEEYPEDELTPCVLITLESNSASSLVSISDDIDLEISTNENGNTVVEESQIHSAEPNFFKTALKVIERISSSSNNSSSSDSGNNAGGSSISIETKESETIDENEENPDEKDKDINEENDSNPSIIISNITNDIPESELNEKIEIHEIEPNTENSSIETITEPAVEDILQPSTDIVDTLENYSISSADTVNSTDDNDVAPIEITSHENTSLMQTEPEDIQKNEPPDEEVFIELETSEPEKTTVHIENSKPEEPFVNTETSDSEKEVSHTKPFQNFINRLLGREKSDNGEDGEDRDDR